MKKISLTIVLMALTSSVFSAQLTQMTLKEISRAFDGKTMTSIQSVHLTEHGKPVENTLECYYDGKGKMFGHMIKPIPSGIQFDQGIDHVDENGTACAQWDHWNDSQKYCVNFYETKDMYLIISTDGTFQTAFRKDKVKTGKHFSE